MIFGTETENAVYLWWNERYDFTDGCYYRVILDNTAVVYTKEILFDFCNMDMSRKHTFTVDMLDKGGRVVGLTEYYETKLIFSKRTALDVTKPPYNVKPDGETDCTQAIQQAFLDCDDKHFVYFPLGTYFCKEIMFGGDIKIVYDSGAVLDKYTVSHIKTINFFNNPKKFGVDASNYYMGSPKDPLFQTCPELNTPIFDKIFKDLYLDGLVTSDSLNSTMTANGMVAKRTSALGDEFLSFIINNSAKQ